MKTVFIIIVSLSLVAGNVTRSVKVSPSVKQRKCLTCSAIRELQEYIQTGVDSSGRPILFGMLDRFKQDVVLRPHQYQRYEKLLKERKDPFLVASEVVNDLMGHTGLNCCPKNGKKATVGDKPAVLICKAIEQLDTYILDRTETPQVTVLPGMLDKFVLEGLITAQDVSEFKSKLSGGDDPYVVAPRVIDRINKPRVESCCAGYEPTVTVTPATNDSGLAAASDKYKDAIVKIKGYFNRIVALNGTQPFDPDGKVLWGILKEFKTKELISQKMSEEYESEWNGKFNKDPLLLAKSVLKYLAVAEAIKIIDEYITKVGKSGGLFDPLGVDLWDILQKFLDNGVIGQDKYDYFKLFWDAQEDPDDLANRVFRELIWTYGDRYKFEIC